MIRKDSGMRGRSSEHLRMDTHNKRACNSTAQDVGSAVAHDCVFFYSHLKGEHACFSQFYPCSFCDEEGQHYNCAEQYMMAAKARLMGDEATMRLVLQSDYDPATVKQLGREVDPFDAALWEDRRIAVVAYGNFLKFTQCEALRKRLVETDGMTLVEAAPRDSIWGVGISVKDAANGQKWQGQNLLGKALMSVRSAISAGQAIPSPFSTCLSGSLRDGGRQPINQQRRVEKVGHR